MAPSLSGVPSMSRLLLILATCSASVSAIQPEYCASFLTTDGPGTSDNLQSNLACSNTCGSGYAFAITQKDMCWCSNYAPSDATQRDMSACSQGCLSYPAEPCGGPGVYSYIALKKQPIGVKGPNSSPDPTPTTKPKPTPTTKQPTTTTTTKQMLSTSTKQQPPPTSSSSTQDDTSTTEAPTHMTSAVAKTVTQDGKLTTVTVIPTISAPGASKNGVGSGSEKSGLSTGAVAGIVIGVIAAVLIAAGVALFFFFRRRRRNQQDDYQDDPSVRGSSSGMTRPEMTTSGGSGGAPGSPSNRNSILAIDPRMNPFKHGLYARSASQESVNTLRDEHDYSRRIQAPKVLRATNPDPETAG